MKIKTIAVFCLGFALTSTILSFGRTAEAKPKRVARYEIESVKLISVTGFKGYLLKLDVKDVEPSSGICSYYVNELIFKKEILQLNIKIQKEFCMNDAYGPSKGSVVWAIPWTLVKKQGRMMITVNGDVLGHVELSNLVPESQENIK